MEKLCECVSIKLYYGNVFFHKIMATHYYYKKKIKFTNDIQQVKLYIYLETTLTCMKLSNQLSII